MRGMEDFVKKCLIDLGSKYHCVNLEMLLLALGMTCILIAVVIVIGYIFRRKKNGNK